MERSNTLKLPLVSAQVDRGRTKLRLKVPEHEVAVLRMVHGNAEVKVLDKGSDKGEFPISANEEYDRLTRTYARVGAPDPVRAAFVMGPSSLEQFGFKAA